MEVSCSISINAPIERVFDVFSDVTQIESRIQGIKSVEIISDVTSGEGVKWRETREMFGREATEEMWISDYQQGSSYEVLAESHGTKYRSVYSFTENSDGGTHVEMTFGGTPVSLFAKIMSLTAFMMKGSLQKMLMADMEDLKVYCESNS